MNYFTQDLIVRGQSHDDKVLNEVEAQWDANCEHYVAYLESIRDRLPPGLRQRLDNYYLHDAVIRGMGRQGNSFVIIVQLDTPPQSIVTFTYDLLSEPEIQKDTLPPDVRGAGAYVDWLYDEVEMMPGEPPTWRQSILLSNGWQLGLHVRDIQVQEVQALLPAPKNGAVAGGPVAVAQPARG
jgi:hypothetical protein